MRDDDYVTEAQPAAWIVTATLASPRLAAEAAVEVDDILAYRMYTSLDQLAALMVRLEESAEAIEVASDLAGLLWAEGQDVPPISTIISEPDLLPALDVIAKARHVAARRLADGAVLEARRRLGQPVAAGPLAGSRRMEMPLVAPAVDPALSVEPASGQGPAPVGAQVEGASPQPVGSSNDPVAIDSAGGARRMQRAERLRLFSTGRWRNRSRFDTDIVPVQGAFHVATRRTSNSRDRCTEA